MAQRSDVKTYRPNAFVPTSSYTGAEQPLILKGENMWTRFGRFGSIYAEGYTGNLDLSEPIATKTLTGTLEWTAGSKTLTGVGTAFVSQLHLGSFVLGDGGAGLTQLFVITKIVSNTSAIVERAPTASFTGTPSGYVLPTLQAIGTDRATAIRCSVVKFPKGHFLGVGDGTFRVNGAPSFNGVTLNLDLAKTPRFAFFDAEANTYTQRDIGIDKPLTPISLAAVATGDTVITAATNASPIVISTVGIHNLYNGQEINISGCTGNTAANGNWTIVRLTTTTFSLTGSTGNGVYIGSGVINVPASQMRAGGYNIRICAKHSQTLGYSNPSDVIAPVTITNGQMIQITFNTAMASDHDSYDIYATAFEDNATSTIEARYMGPWFLVKTVTASMLKSTATPLGTETSTYFVLSYTDAEISTSQGLLSFDNFAPKPAEFCDYINGIPLYFSCLGQGNTTDRDGTSPGPAAIPSKPSNPEAVFLNKALTTAGGDYIVGEFNAKSRIYALCQNSLQTVILTTVDAEPIAFRSLWNSGFRNPYNVAFVKEYLYGFSTQKIVRSVAGGDDSAMEFEFASDIRDYIVDWETGHVLVGYCPKNRAVVYFYAAAERRSGYWVTIALPFLLDKQVWNPPIILKKTNTDFIVSGVATVGQQLTFLAGGRTSGGSISVGTYVFDGGDSEDKSWYLAWNYTDDGQELNPKTIKGMAVTGRFAAANDTKAKVYGVEIDGTFDFTSLAAGTNAQFEYSFGSTSGNIVRKRYRYADAGSYPLYTVRMEGIYTTTADRLDEIAVKVEVNSSET